MPYVENKLVTPDEAFRQGLCPECAHELDDVDPETHIHEHWRDFDAPMFDNAEAKRRGQMIRDFGRRKAEAAKQAAKPAEAEDKPAESEADKAAKIDQLEKELEALKAQP